MRSRGRSYCPRRGPYSYGQSGSYKQPKLKPFRPRGGPYDFHLGKTPKITKKWNRPISTNDNEDDYFKRLMIIKTQTKKLKQKLGEKKYFEIVKNIYRKIIEHGDTIEKVAGFGKTLRELSWKEQKQKIEKQFPYLTSKEIDFLGVGSGLKKYK